MQFVLDRTVTNVSEAADARNYVRLIAGMQEAKTELVFAFWDFYVVCPGISGLVSIIMSKCSLMGDFHDVCSSILDNSRYISK